MKTVRRMILAAAALFALGFAPGEASAQYNYGFRSNLGYTHQFSNQYYSQYTRVTAGNAGYAYGNPYGYGFSGGGAANYATVNTVYSNRYGTWSNSYAVNTSYNAYNYGNGYGYGLGYAPAYYGPNYYTGAAYPAVSGGYTAPVVPVQQVSYNVKSVPAASGVYGNWVSQRAATEAVKTVKATFTDKEIVSGEAINAVIEQIAHGMTKQEAKELDALEAAKLNFTSSKGIGQFGYLAYGSVAKLPWGDAFAGLDAEGQALLKTLKTQVADVFERNSKEEATKEPAREAKRTLSKLSDVISSQISTLGLMKYSEAKAMLRNLDSTLGFLAETPEIQPWKRGLHTKTVGELVKCFTDNQLKAVPALPGSEKAYQDLYTVLRKVADNMPAKAALE